MTMPPEKLAMITQPTPAGQASWQLEYADIITDVAELLDLLSLKAADLETCPQAARQFPLRVPRSFAARMTPGDPADPLLRQVLAVPQELQDSPGFTSDPLAEAEATPLPGILQKYAGRALLMVTGACAVHCRYCFRRHYPYSDSVLTGPRLELALAWLASHPEISEVILSGGDPLSVSDHKLSGLIAHLMQIPHLRRLRIHSRLPVVLPSRITAELVNTLAACRVPTTLVIHVNHPRELRDMGAGLEHLRRAGVHCLNQSVLLAGVNDSAQILVALSEALFEHGVLPYYLHCLDPVAGSGHFAVEEAHMASIYRDMRARLPGYLLPRLVRELPGEIAKQPLDFPRQDGQDIFSGIRSQQV